MGGARATHARRPTVKSQRPLAPRNPEKVVLLSRSCAKAQIRREEDVPAAAVQLFNPEYYLEQFSGVPTPTIRAPSSTEKMKKRKRSIDAAALNASRTPKIKPQPSARVTPPLTTEMPSASACRNVSETTDMDPYSPPVDQDRVVAAAGAGVEAGAENGTGVDTGAGAGAGTGTGVDAGAGAVTGVGAGAGAVTVAVAEVDYIPVCLSPWIE
eukprot:jgi/Undpi1/4859/HiC_scaffold_19.g08212.m1